MYLRIYILNLCQSLINKGSYDILLEATYSQNDTEIKIAHNINNYRYILITITTKQPSNNVLNSRFIPVSLCKSYYQTLYDPRDNSKSVACYFNTSNTVIFHNTLGDAFIYVYGIK